MAAGTVKWFNAQKGFRPDEGSNDVFVHISAVERSGIGTLRDGQKLSYELEGGNQGKIRAVALKALQLPRTAPLAAVLSLIGRGNGSA